MNQGGLLALSSNIGKYNHDAFVAVPQISLRVGYLRHGAVDLYGWIHIHVLQPNRTGRRSDRHGREPEPDSTADRWRPKIVRRSTSAPSDLVLQGITLGGEHSFSKRPKGGCGAGFGKKPTAVQLQKASATLDGGCLNRAIFQKSGNSIPEK